MHTTIPFGGGGAGGESAECTAVAADILAGKTAIHKESNDEAGEGTMTNVAATEAAKSAVLSSGVLYERMTHGAHVTNASSGYPEVSLPQATLASVIDLTADIIKKGESILGITGTFEGYASEDYGDTPNLLSLGMIAAISSYSSGSTSSGTIGTSYTRSALTTARAGRRTWPDDDESNSTCAGMVWERSYKLDTTGYPYMSCNFYVTPRSGRSMTGDAKYFTPFIDWLTSDSDKLSTARSANHNSTSVQIAECLYGETPDSPLTVLFDISKIQERKARLFFGGFLTTSGSSNTTLYLYTRRIRLYKEKPSDSFDVTLAYT